jgi:hypothetical protein
MALFGRLKVSLKNIGWRRSSGVADFDACNPFCSILKETVSDIWPPQQSRQDRYRCFVLRFRRTALGKIEDPRQVHRQLQR